MNIRAALIILCLLVGGFLGLNAAPATEKSPYRLQCGDRLYVMVYGDLSTRRLVLVDPSGNVNYLFAKNIPAKGQTISALRDKLTHKMATYYKDPILMITLVTCLGESYAILGEVREPGYKKLEGNPTLLSALCEAKGFTTRLFRNQTVDQADLEKSFLARDGEYVPVDFTALVQHGDITQDVRLKGGDYIYVAASGLKKIYVLGEVSSPAVIEYLYGTTLAQAITEAGGVTTSASSRVAVIRGSLAYPVRFLIDVNRILKGKALDFPLEPGDIVYVPPMKFSVLKEIVKSGIANFVSIVSSAAGAATFVSIQPAASGVATQAVIDTAATNLITPVTTVP